MCSDFFNDSGLPSHLTKQKYWQLAYLQLLDTETKRKIKKEPALAVEMRCDVFQTGGCDENGPDSARDIVSNLWSFS